MSDAAQNSSAEGASPSHDSADMQSAKTLKLIPYLVWTAEKFTYDVASDPWMEPLSETNDLEAAPPLQRLYSEIRDRTQKTPRRAIKFSQWKQTVRRKMASVLAASSWIGYKGKIHKGFEHLPDDPSDPIQLQESWRSSLITTPTRNAYFRASLEEDGITFVVSEIGEAQGDLKEQKSAFLDLCQFSSPAEQEVWNELQKLHENGESERATALLNSRCKYIAQSLFEAKGPHDVAVFSFLKVPSESFTWKQVDPTMAPPDRYVAFRVYTAHPDATMTRVSSCSSARNEATDAIVSVVFQRVQERRQTRVPEDRRRRPDRTKLSELLTEVVDEVRSESVAAGYTLGVAVPIWVAKDPGDAVATVRSEAPPFEVA